MEFTNVTGLAVVSFASSNIDDIFILLSFFANRRYRTLQIIIGQYLGITALVLVSIMISMISLIFTPAYVGLLGLLPVLIGLKKLYDLRKAPEDETKSLKMAGFGNIMAVAVVTIANGGDNIGIYTPVFANNSAPAITTILTVFTIMTAVWLLVAYWLVNHPALKSPIQKFGHIITPLVLISIGMYILHEAGALWLLIRAMH